MPGYGLGYSSLLRRSSGPSGPAYGALTTAWIAATGETDLTILSALNTLESDLTTYGLTSKMTALYPFVGGSATKHSYNFMNTAQYQITWNGGITHNSNGVTGNGTNGYGNTNLNYTTLNSGHQSLYSRSAVTEASPVYDMGAYNGGNTWQLLSLYTQASLFIGGFNSDSQPRSALSNSSGFFMNNRTASNAANLWRSGTKLVQSTQAVSAIPNINNFIGALNSVGTASNYSAKNFAFASIGDGLTDTEAANFYTAVQTFQTTLGRSIGTQTVSDADAQAFVTAANIQDQVQATAINNLVIGLKTDGLWAKMKAIYPFVGGTSTTHSYNLKNTSQYQITFNGGWTHSSTGALPNGTNGYADTALNTNLISQNSGHLSIYNRTDTMGLFTDIGADDSLNGCNSIWSRHNNLTYNQINNATSNYLTYSNTNSQGHYISNRTASNILNGWKNGSKNASSTLTSILPANKIIYIGALHDWSSPNFYSNREYAFASIGDGLTDTEAANFYTAVQAFQTTLSRNV